MHSTKRKFNALLQGLGTPHALPDEKKQPASLGSPSRTADDVEALLQKRRRLGIPQSNSTMNLGALGSPGHNSVPPSKSTRVTLVTPEKPLARFCPSDREELLKRLATFQDITGWTPKPDRVSEIAWANRGWVCHGKETVRCVLCHKELVVRLNKKTVDGKEVPVLVPSEIESALVDKYEGLIVDSHLEDCLWRKRGCDDTLLRLPLASTSTALQGLKERYQELCSRQSFLPYEFNLRLPEDFDVNVALAELPSDFLPKEASPDGPNRAALILALFGWQGLSNTRMGAVPNSASCHTCLRRLGLWMFKSKEVSESGEILVPAPMDHLEPVREHRFFCPWKNAETQKLPGTHSAEGQAVPGWKILLQTLHNDAHLRRMYESRPQARPRSEHEVGAAPSTPTPSREVQDAPSTPVGAVTSSGDVDSTQAPASEVRSAEEEGKEQEAKDKERWARLKRVKSLFGIKGSRKDRPLSRPGTSRSTRKSGEAS